MKLLSFSLAVLISLYSVGCKGNAVEVAAEAKIQVYEAADTKGFSDLTNDEARAFVTSDAVLELVAEQHDFRELWKVNCDEVVLRLRKATEVTVTSSLMSIGVSLETKELSTIVTNLIAKTFCGVVADHDRKARDQRRAILDTELEECRDHYVENRKEVVVYVQQYGVSPRREELETLRSEEDKYAQAQER